MNLQTHLSGQMPNQGAVPQQNGNMLQNPQMQNLGGGGGGAATLSTSANLLDTDFNRARQYIRSRIYNLLLQRQPPPIDDAVRTKYADVAKRLEEGLLRRAVSKEDYLNQQTFEQRLTSVISNRPLQNFNQRQATPSSSSGIGTMMPTPGISHGASLNSMATAVDSSMSGGGSVNSGNLLPSSGLDGGSFNRSDGSLSNGYPQSSANFSIVSGGNMPSMGVQRISSQMMPTPGFSSGINGNSTNSNTDSCINVEPSNEGGFPTVEPTLVPRFQQQRQHIGGQNSRILHTLGSQMGGGFRSGLQPKPYGSMNGSLGGGLGMNVNSIQHLNGARSSESLLNVTPYGNPSKPSQQSFDQMHQPGMNVDGYGMSNPDSFGSGNIYGAVTSAGPITNSNNMDLVNNLHSLPRANSLMSNQSNSHAMQKTAPKKPQSVDHYENMNVQSSLTSRENMLNKQQQYQQQPYQFQQQYTQLQRQPKQQSQQHQQLTNSDAYGQPQLASNPVTQIKREPGVEHHSGVLRSQASEQFQPPESQNQFEQNSAEYRSKDTHYHSEPTGQHDIRTSLPQSSQLMQQMLHSQHSVPESFNDLSSLFTIHSESHGDVEYHPQSQSSSQLPGNISHGHLQEDIHQRVPGQNEVQMNNMPIKGSVVGQTVTPGNKVEVTNTPNSSGATYRCGNENSDTNIRNQQKWLLFLLHARRCKVADGKCSPYCILVQNLWRHIETCTSPRCSYARCYQSKKLVDHTRNCSLLDCPVCVPAKDFIQRQEREKINRNSTSAIPSLTGGSCKSYDSGDASDVKFSDVPSGADVSDDLQPSLKRMKIEQISHSLAPVIENFTVNEPHVNVQRKAYQHADLRTSARPPVVEVKGEVLDMPGQRSTRISELKNDAAEETPRQRLQGESVMHIESLAPSKPEGISLEKDAVATQKLVTEPAKSTAETKSGKPNVKGVSLTELFTPDQVREHINGLRKWVGQSKAKAEKNQAMEHSMSENSCQLCAVEKLTFEPPPIYCTPCGARIKRNAMYYTIGGGETRHCFCIPCYNEARGENIVVDGSAISKARLEKRKNDEETEEWWVQCDKCEAWQHQICALFNGRRNDGGQAEYTCPNCYIAEVERGERQPLPQSAVLGAKDLPTTILSDHIEQRLFRRLKQERQDRARVQGRSYDEVPGAEALVVRVVSSVDKKLEVKQRFLEIFREDNYPVEYPYKSKVVLLFQKIEGVEVCLFGMYVQEFGSECSLPNHRRVYLSYLDSVKYFRPEIKAVSGEALRTFVYHEILIGYLEYCKKRGFTSCYIWACPPLKGEDYILYCHPEIQKTPKSDKLREWYLAMLRKAAKENIVAECTNLYDHFFVQTGECRAKVTAARLPYFDGDYWPGAAEDLIYQMNQDEDGRKQYKKGPLKKTITKRALKASGQSDLSANASKDLLLMHKLGESISPMKEDFIMVHLQRCCTHCCTLMVSGNYWTCNQCKNFQLCDKCYEAEQQREERDKHPIHHRMKHLLHLAKVADVCTDTKDKDDILESEFFDTRQAFLSLCQGNHYQYDTLRRAKHSSMMVLYHLHNPTAPAFVTTCNVCHLDIETGQGWRCEICPDYDICNACYSKEGGVDHPHKLTNHPSIAERDAQNKEARQQRVLQLRKMLDLLVHASECHSPQCQYPNCRKVKGLFRHGIHCKVRASNGCPLCKKMWYLLQLHSRACRESKCHVPRCRDLREHLKRLQQQSDSRRRAAVMEMMRQRAAEVASG